VYAIPPSATHAGHRADSWDVDKWLRAVRVKVTSKARRPYLSTFLSWLGWESLGHASGTAASSVETAAMTR